MSNSKRIILSLKPEMLCEVDAQSEVRKMNRSEWIREAIALYLKEGEKIRIREQMRKGYQEMGLLNLQLSEEGLAQDQEDFAFYENRLNIGE
ncbi:MAG: ribbon-helix-helix protein, CopG family [Anaerovorax sp.]|nr:ribbon-helix-helix protein, CopG family [Anaerovorax sp.]